MMRFLFWGTYAQFSLHVLQGLLAGGMQPIGVMVAGGEECRHLSPPPPSPLPIVPQNIVELAWAASIPVWQSGNLNRNELAQVVIDLAVDVSVVACFPQLFPASLLILPQSGFVNVHPSLLPAFRGPAPIYHQLQQGLSEIGVTLHVMDENFDTGPILTQQKIKLPANATEHEAERLCAKVGAQLLKNTLSDWCGGKIELTLQAKKAPKNLGKH